MLCTADATATAKLVEATLDTADVVDLRTTRGAYPVFYEPTRPSWSVGPRSCSVIPTTGSPSSA
ncbi:MAG: hypothetical protein ACRD03_16045 [Acidimicrobiales bacterium]